MAYRSAGAEEYLEAIYQLAELGEPATTSRLAEWLDVAPPSVSEMIRRLGEQDLVHYRPYRAIRLTDQGCIQASRLLRRQRLWEVFLYEHLHVPWHQVFVEACNLEHGTSALTESYLERFLGYPEFCPHGYPIPEVRETVALLIGTPLSTLEAGQSRSVRRIPEQQQTILKYLQSHSIVPGVQLTVLAKAPSKSHITVQTATEPVALAFNLAQTIVMEADQD